MGDLHGDLSKTRRALEMAGVLSSDGQDLWIGGETVCHKFIIVPHHSVVLRIEDRKNITYILLYLKKKFEPHLHTYIHFLITVTEIVISKSMLIFCFGFVCYPL